MYFHVFMDRIKLLYYIQSYNTEYTELLIHSYNQGGIFSPYLFCVYMDDLSNKLNYIKVGCTIDATLINHIMYEYDLVLLSPSAMGLSLLLSVCSAYTLNMA